MNYKLEINKLEQIKQTHLIEAKYHNSEVSKISEKIREYLRLYNKYNKMSDDANRILAGYNKQTLREILLFFMSIFRSHSDYKNVYQKVDFRDIIKDEEFFDLVINVLGENLIGQIRKKFTHCEVIDGETMIAPKGFDKDKNLGARLNKKMTNRIIREYLEGRYKK